MQELHDAVFCIKTNKAPGIDGLPIEVYQKLWDILNIPLLQAYEQVYENEKMYTQAMRCVKSYTKAWKRYAIPQKFAATDSPKC